MSLTIVPRMFAPASVSEREQNRIGVKCVRSGQHMMMTESTRTDSDTTSPTSPYGGASTTM